MSIIRIKNVIQRVFKMTWDMDYIQNAIYNDRTGAQKGMNIEPVVTGVYVANAQVAFGSYIKVAAGTTSYGVDCVGKAHSASDVYRRGDLRTEAGFVYIANQDITDAHAFDAGEWTKVAPKVIAAIPVSGDAVTVCVGKYHNAISVAGFTIDDETKYMKVE